MKRILTLSITITIISVLCFTGQPLKSQDSPPLGNVSNKFVVDVYVNCDDNITKSSIESYLKTELRNLKDVVVHTPNSLDYPNYGLSLIVIEPTTVQGVKTGSTIISSVFVNFIYFDDIIPYEDLVKVDGSNLLTIEEYAFLMGKFTPVEKILNELPPFLYADFIDNVLFFQPDPTKISNTCKKIVANFDTKSLEKAREKR